MNRSRIGIVTVLVLGSLAPNALAMDATSCAAAFEDGQKQVLEGHFLRGREAFATCMSNDCPGVVREACDKRLEDMSARVPSVVFAATSRGADVVDVRVALDDEPVPSTLAGKAMEVDPGAHRATFTAPDGRTGSMSFVAREGEKFRRIEWQMPEPSSTAPTPQARSSAIPWTFYLTGGVAVVGAGVSTYFGVRGLSQYGDLSDRCSPHCSEADQSSLRGKLVVADVAGAMAIVAGVATVWIFVQSRHSSPTTTASMPLRFAF